MKRINALMVLLLSGLVLGCASDTTMVEENCAADIAAGIELESTK